MAAKNMKDILRSLQNIREDLSMRQHQYLACHQEGRERRLVTYLSELEQSNVLALKTLIESYDDRSSQWIRYYPDDCEQSIQASLRSQANWSDTKHLVQTTIAIKKKLLSILKVCSENQNVERIQDFFAKMTKTEETQIQKLGRRLVELDQGY